MTTDEQEETHHNDELDSPKPTNRSATTQVGQVIEELSKLTQRFPSARARLRRPPHASARPSRERQADLIAALGDPNHPDHTIALDVLIDIGSPAIPALSEALQEQYPWLTSFRAAEALGCIGDGRATGPLIQALRHPHSNVRWGAVRALAQVGDLRTLLELRRVAHEDQGRTSWGESVAGAAQSALDQIQQQSVWAQGLELIKTAITSVLMILALILAFSVITTLSNELENAGRFTPASSTTTSAPAAATDTVTETESANQDQADDPAPAPPLDEPEPEADQAPLATVVISGTVLNNAKIRPFPSILNDPIGSLKQSDDIFFLARSTDRQWYLVRLGENHSASSYIDNPDGSRTGWIHRMLVSTPEGEIPIEEIDLPEATEVPEQDEPPDQPAP